ncbi:hypothetical protein ACFX13_005192 [Malus domestica]
MEFSKFLSSLATSSCTPPIALKNPSSKKWSIPKDHSLLSTPLKPLNSKTKYTSSKDGIICFQHEQKLDDLRSALKKVGGQAVEGLDMIDAVQRLGIDYHFEDEIDQILQKQHIISSTTAHGAHDPTDLHEVALRFRLLRQHGYFVSDDVFNNFKEGEGNFNQMLSEDIKGLMSLYEASKLSTEGEVVLEEAGKFSGHFLNSSLLHLDHHQARVVENTLRNPHHKSLAPFMAKNFFVSGFQGTYNRWLNILQTVAKTDLYMVQSLHQKEVVQVSKWWEELGLSKELKFARDQPIKWYNWSMAGLTNPNLSDERIEFTKSVSFIYLIDDIFDVYGTLDDLTLFTEVVNRWEIGAIEHLPDYMKICFKALYDMTDEISCKVYEKHGWNPLHSLKKTWASLCNAFLVEAKWFKSGHLPRAEEYLKNGIISSGDENQDGDDGSYINYYLNEHQGKTMEEAQEHVTNMISQEWKKLNKVLVSPNPFPAAFTKASLNLARMVPLMYSYDDNQRLPSLDEYVESMLHA